jgi:lysophospholipase
MDLPAPADGARGSLLFLPGRGDFIEKYLESLDDWAQRGWQVTALDWRGQGASGRLGGDARTGHIGDFAQWVEDLTDFWQQWTIGRDGPRVVIAHSMGGHLALRAAAEGRIDPDALVLSAPMLGLAGRLPAAVMHQLARAFAAVGDDRRAAWKWRDDGTDTLAWRATLLTHDAERYADEIWWRRQRPDLVMGPGSWRWLERAYASMRQLARPGVLERIEVPVLILASTADRLVSFRAIAHAARRLPRAELLAFGPEAAHEILREVDPVRERALARIDKFLDRIATRR